MDATRNNETTTYGLRWIEINKRFELVNKEREFKSADARTKFIDNLMESGNLYEITASLN